MPDNLYGGLSENQFRNMAKTTVADFWNGNQTLVDEFGYLEASEVYVVWSCKTIQNFKALLGAPKDGDGMYFECTYNGDSQEAYLDVYRKQDHILVRIVPDMLPATPI